MSTPLPSPEKKKGMANKVSTSTTTPCTVTLGYVLTSSGSHRGETYASERGARMGKDQRERRKVNRHQPSSTQL